MSTTIEIASPSELAALLNSGEGQRALRRMPNALIIDMDDTLISNQALFDDAHVALASIYETIDAQGRSADELDALHREMDSANVPAMGYTPERWFYSSTQVAEHVAGRALTEREREQIFEAANIAMGVGEILEGCEQALEALSRARVHSLLKTKGSLSKQTEKLAAHRFDRYFGTAIEIVDRKDSRSFRALASKYALRAPASIGDSEKSDIIPALEAGFAAVLIDKSHRASLWQAESADHGAPRVHSFPEAVALLADLL